MKTKLYIEKLFKLVTAVGGFSVVALASSLAIADERSLTEQLEAAEAARVADEASFVGGPRVNVIPIIDATQDIRAADTQKERFFAIFTLIDAAQNLNPANTEQSFFEALGEQGSLATGSSDEKGARGVYGRALGLKLSETLWKSSEGASEDAAATFIRDKIDVFNNENNREFKFAKEDYFDDFADRQEKGATDKVAQDVLDRNREDKIERIASAAERREERRAEKAAKNEEKAEVKAEKRAEKEEAKQEKDDKKDDAKDDGTDGGKKGEKGK